MGNDKARHTGLVTAESCDGRTASQGSGTSTRLLVQRNREGALLLLPLPPTPPPQELLPEAQLICLPTNPNGMTSKSSDWLRMTA